MEIEEEVVEEESESSSRSETSDEDTVAESLPVFQAEFRPYVQNCLDTMSPPFPESDLKAAWHAAIFNVPKRKRGDIIFWLSNNIRRATRTFWKRYCHV